MGIGDCIGASRLLAAGIPASRVGSPRGFSGSGNPVRGSFGRQIPDLSPVERSGRPLGVAGHGGPGRDPAHDQRGVRSLRLTDLRLGAHRHGPVDDRSGLGGAGRPRFGIGGRAAGGSDQRFAHHAGSNPFADRDPGHVVRRHQPESDPGRRLSGSALWPGESADSSLGRRRSGHAHWRPLSLDVVRGGHSLVRPGADRIRKLDPGRRARGWKRGASHGCARSPESS